MSNAKLPRGMKLHPLLVAVERSELSQRALAKRLGISQQTVCQMVALARGDRDYVVPARYIATLAHMAEQPVSDYLPMFKGRR